MRVYVFVCVRACVCVCVRACVRVCVQIYVNGSMSYKYATMKTKNVIVLCAYVVLTFRQEICFQGVTYDFNNFTQGAILAVYSQMRLFAR